MSETDVPKTDTGKRKRGPPKRKQQYTLRLDADLMVKVRQMAQHPLYPYRITDIVERALFLALKERGCDVSSHYKTNLGWLVEDCTTQAEQEYILAFAIFLVLDRLTGVSPAELLMREFVLKYLALQKKHWPEALAVYLRQGRILEEFRKRWREAECEMDGGLGSDENHQDGKTYEASTLSKREAEALEIYRKYRTAKLENKTGEQ